MYLSRNFINVGEYIIVINIENLFKIGKFDIHKYSMYLFTLNQSETAIMGQIIFNFALNELRALFTCPNHQ
jgi:hypothetical protein